MTEREWSSLGIKNGIQIKLLAGSAAGGLPVKDHAAVRLAAGILAGVRGLRVGRGDDLALSGAVTVTSATTGCAE